MILIEIGSYKKKINKNRKAMCWLSTSCAFAQKNVFLFAQKTCTVNQRVLSLQSLSERAMWEKKKFIDRGKEY